MTSRVVLGVKEPQQSKTLKVLRLKVRLILYWSGFLDIFTTLDLFRELITTLCTVFPVLHWFWRHQLKCLWRHGHWIELGTMPGRSAQFCMLVHTNHFWHCESFLSLWSKLLMTYCSGVLRVGEPGGMSVTSPREKVKPNPLFLARNDWWFFF